MKTACEPAWLYFAILVRIRFAMIHTRSILEVFYVGSRVLLVVSDGSLTLSTALFLWLKMSSLRNALKSNKAHRERHQVISDER